MHTEMENADVTEYDTDIQVSSQPSVTSNNSRKKFAAKDDVILLRAVNSFCPWKAPIGTSNGIMKVFEDIAQKCQQDSNLELQKAVQHYEQGLIH